MEKNTGKIGKNNGILSLRKSGNVGMRIVAVVFIEEEKVTETTFLGCYRYGLS